jgi:hypothetical protein
MDYYFFTEHALPDTFRATNLDRVILEGKNPESGLELIKKILIQPLPHPSTLLEPSRKQQIEILFLVYQICWNCSRPASETCSGCKVAKYCGSFCQHKDWESHHRICRASQEELAAAGRLAASGGRGVEDYQPDQPVTNGHSSSGGGTKSAGASPKEF